MLKRIPRAAGAVLTIVLTGGCGLAGLTPAKSPAAAPASARSGFGSVNEATRNEAAGTDGTVPDPCTLLTREEVAELTGREITQVDEDGVDPGGAARSCQWQHQDGRLAVVLTRTTADDFRAATDGSQVVEGVGFWNSNHLYVLHGTVQLDVYSHGDDEPTNLEVSKQVVDLLVTRV